MNRNPLNPNNQIGGRVQHVIEPYITDAPKGYSGLIDSNLVFGLGLSQEESTLISDKMIDWAFDSKTLSRSNRSIFIKHLRQANELYVDTDYVHWYLKNAQSDFVTLQEARGHVPGQRFATTGTLETLVFDTASFSVNGELTPRNAWDIRLRIVSEGRMVGPGQTAYEVELMDGGRFNYVPDEYLIPGETVWDYKPMRVGELSSGWDNHMISLGSGCTYYRFESSVSEFGLTFKLSDKVARKGLVRQSYYKGHPDGSYFRDQDLKDTVMPLGVLEIRAAVKRYEEDFLLWGKDYKERLLDHTSQKPVVTFDGLFEILKYASKEEYPLGSSIIDYIEGFIHSNFAYTTDFNSGRIKYVAYAGADAMRDATKEISARQIARGAYYDRMDIEGKTNRKLFGRDVMEPRAWNYDTWLFPTFGEVQFVHMPELDDIRLSHNVRRPDTGNPISSSMMFITKIGEGDGMDWDGGLSGNMTILKKRSADAEGWLLGVTTPMGPMHVLSDGKKKEFSQGFYGRSHNGRYSEYFMNRSIGLLVKDVSDLIVLTPSYGYGLGV